MLVGDHHRHAAGASDQRAPNIGAEHVRVQHVEAFTAQKRREGEEAVQLPRARAAETDVAYTGALEYAQRGVQAATRRADPRFDSVLRQVRCQPGDEPLSPADGPGVVHQQEHAKTP